MSDEGPVEPEGDDGSDAHEPATPSLGARLWRWVRVVAAALAVGALVPVAGAAWWLGPYVRDDLVLDRIVAAAALDWRDFGRDKAEERLQYELDARGIGMQVDDEHCAFSEPEPGAMRIRCAWEVVFTVPGTEYSVPLPFASEAEISPEGDLR